METKAITTTNGNTERALLLQSLDEAQVTFLMQRTPKEEIKSKPGRGGKAQHYIEHAYVTELLNKVFGFNWDFQVTSREMLDDEVIVEARLTVRTPQGATIIKEQFGGCDIERFKSGPNSGKPLSIADNYKAAASDALKKCASLLGVGLDLYGRDYEPASAPEAPQARPVEVIAPSQHTKRKNAAIDARYREGWKAGDLAELYGMQWEIPFERLTEGEQVSVCEYFEQLKPRPSKVEAVGAKK